MSQKQNEPLLITPELEALIRRIVREEIAKALKEEQQHRRFGQPVNEWPPYERKGK